ncbi:type I secretion C-terminal target domain-containing protein [Endozoicomonas ascidiicola]|uniref:type I secretion C-terminal target domain-containing protein n=1 Tax=Endozoicomonas ascidiicola TaxID=1698521 RepID=UPI000BA3C399
MTHEITNPRTIKNISFDSDNGGDDVLDVSALLSGSSVDETNVDQYVKVTPMGAFVDTSGSGEFSQLNQVARFTASSGINTTIAVQVSNTSIHDLAVEFSFDNSVHKPKLI